MVFLARFSVAGILILMSSAIVVAWLCLLIRYNDPSDDSMPWAADVILYGPALVAVAALVGTPGILWSNHLAKQVPPDRRLAARMPGWLGAAILAIGFSVALGALLSKALRAKPFQIGRMFATAVKLLPPR